ncbi:hypothetical protein WJX84_002872 [Apatococcus fuscideae]|uniref:J domain-containing protein n=1 Tax=Apatococcus fuscideae TaxID=2026836 RepID=A0AAW1TAE3_9CHLO
MADRAFERAFNKAAVGESLLRVPKKPKLSADVDPGIPVDSQAQLCTPAQPEQVHNAIAKILQAEKDQDLFSLLELPLPDVDDLGRPVWSCSASDVSKAFRRLSVHVHPDKNPDPEARAAFEALSSAHRQLRDTGLLEEILNKEVDRAKQRRDAAEANATPDERIAMNAAHRERARELRQKEGQSFQAEILRQLREKQDKAKRKRQAQSRSRHKDESEESEPDEQVSAGASATSHTSAVKLGVLASKRGKPKLIF